VTAVLRSRTPDHLVVSFSGCSGEISHACHMLKRFRAIPIACAYVCAHARTDRIELDSISWAAFPDGFPNIHINVS